MKDMRNIELGSRVLLELATDTLQLVPSPAVWKEEGRGSHCGRSWYLGKWALRS